MLGRSATLNERVSAKGCNTNGLLIRMKAEASTELQPVDLARDEREHAIPLLDELSSEQPPTVNGGRCVDVEHQEVVREGNGSRS